MENRINQWPLHYLAQINKQADQEAKVRVKYSLDCTQGESSREGSNSEAASS